MIKRLLTTIAGVITFLMATQVNAALITYNDSLLGSGLSVSSGGVNLTSTTSGGALSNIASGSFAGLWFGPGSAIGSYTLAFSQAIDSIELEFDAMSDVVGLGAAETMTGFSTSNGAISINYTNQFGTSFDGTTITKIGGVDNGQGIINYSGAAFNSFTFFHSQGAQNGSVFERIVINTASLSVPEPSIIALFGLGLFGLGFARRRKA